MDKIRDVLSSILESAVRYELLVKNPVEGIRLPKPKRGKRSKPFVTPDQFCGIGRIDRGAVRHDGLRRGLHRLRVSELIGLRWRNVQTTRSRLRSDTAGAIGDRRRAKPATQQCRSTRR